MSINVNKLAARYEALKGERSGWDTAWETLAELFLPTRWRIDTDETAHKQPKLNPRLVNPVGVLAMRTLAAGLHGGMTSPVRPWFRLQLAGEQSTMPGVNAWLDEVTQRMQFYFQQSNFYDCIHGLYSDLGTFGTGLLIETADEQGLQFDLVRAGEYVLDVNEKGVVDTFFRRFFMTPRQIIAKWGEENVPQCVKTAAKNGGTSSTTRFNIIHGVFPRDDAKYNSLGKAGMPFVSVYWLHEAGNGAAKGSLLSEGGYKMFPAFAPRWDLVGLDVYGRSPAMDVAPDVKMLQAMTTTLRKMQHKIADPPMVGDSSLRRLGVDRNPGGFTWGDLQTTQGRPLVVPIQQPDAQALQWTMTAIEKVEDEVRQGLYVDLFRMMVDDNRNRITATEVEAKQNEKMLLLGPVVERMHNELLSPLIKRTYALMNEWGALPESPPGMEGTSLDIRFESVLARAQRLMSTSAIDQGVAFVANFASMKPAVLDLLDSDATVRSYLNRVGVPESCLADEDSVDAIRQQRAEAEAQAQQQQQAQVAMQGIVDASAAAKNLGQTPVGADDQTLMGTLLGGITGG